MSVRRRRRDDPGEREIDLTPMLDVVFIMLIFFIVTASFAKESGLDVDRPDGSIAPEHDPPIVVSIDADDQIEIGSRAIDPRAVTANVARALAEAPQRPLVMRVSERASNGTFVRVLDQIRLAGAEPDQLARVALVPLE